MGWSEAEENKPDRRGQGSAQFQRIPGVVRQNRRMDHAFEQTGGKSSRFHPPIERQMEAT
jgi:hypothetical protein